MDADVLEHYNKLLTGLNQLWSKCQALASDLTDLVTGLQDGRFGFLKDRAERMIVLEQNFHTFKKEALSIFGATVSPSDIDKVTSLKDVETLLQTFSIRLRQDALHVLDDVLSIVHKDNKDHQALQSCHAKARALQQAILKIEPPGLHPDVPALLNGTHPFNELLLLVRQHQKLDEESLEEMQGHIQIFFSRLLFLAIVRGKLEFSSSPEEQPDQGPDRSEEEPVVTQKISATDRAIDKPVAFPQMGDTLQKPTQGRAESVSKPAKEKDTTEEQPDQRPDQSEEEPVVTQKISATDRATDKPVAFPRMRDSLQKPTLGRSESVSKPTKEKDEFEEDRNAILKNMTQIKFQLERALEYNFIVKKEYQRLSDIIREIEVSTSENIDLAKNKQSLMSVQKALDDSEAVANEAKRKTMKQGQEEISQTKTKLERSLESGFIRKDEYEKLSADIQKIEASILDNRDFLEDKKNLVMIRSMLDEKEMSIVEARRLAMRQKLGEISQIKLKLERSLESGFIQNEEYEKLSADIQEIEASILDNRDEGTDNNSFSVIQDILDEREMSTVEARRLEMQQTLEEISQIKLKLERSLKFGFIQKEEYERLSADFQKIEASILDNSDGGTDNNSFLVIQDILDEREMSIVEARRLEMRREFQETRSFFLENNPDTSSNK